MTNVTPSDAMTIRQMSKRLMTIGQKS